MRKLIYAWDDWFRPPRIVLSKGTHYQCSTSTFMQQIRNAASKRGLSVSVTELHTGAGVLVEKQHHPTQARR